MLTILSNTTSIISSYLHELRDVNIQKDRQRFERNLEMLGVIAGYELSKQLAYAPQTTTTPLGSAETSALADKLVLATILRAGLPVQTGIHKVLPQAEPCFIAAGRKPDTSQGVAIDLAYVAGPSIADKVLILADTMLATGHSLVEAYQALIKSHGQPSKVFIVAVIGSQAGVAYVTENIPNCELLVCAVDAELNDQYFIVPGLGDAGDLLYGDKL